MANYTDLSTEQVITLVSQYDLGKVTSCSLMEGGLANSSFHLVAEAGEYVATITNSGIKSEQETENLIALLRYLQNAEFRTSEVISTPDGAYVIQVDDGTLFLKKYIKGNVIRDLEPKHLRQIGEQLSQLHIIDSPEYLPDVFSYGIEKFDDVILSDLPDPFLEWLDNKRGYILPFINDTLPKSLIHGDLFYDNVIVDHNSLTLTDFEEACHYYRVYDLGTTITGTCADPSGKIKLELIRALLQGYQKNNQLTDREKSCLKAFAVYGAVSAAFWRFRQYHIDYPEPQSQQRHLEMAVVADNLFSIPEDVWSELY